uniref:Endoplasmic reticulum vesicle transporter C-terminal domain-containing protein n=1 Tax=Ciona savignyi TaxID=51511 RepID=H2Z4S0_CIOSA
MDVVKGKADACRFYGNLPLNKVAGNFHIVAGKPVQIFGGHAHMSLMFSPIPYNFSHRIDHLSFGNMNTGFINALDGDERIANTESYTFQYYLDIVATKINSRRIKTDTFQFSVSEQSRKLDHTSGSHGQPGVFFKYDFSPLSVVITEQKMPFYKFLVRL